MHFAPRCTKEIQFLGQRAFDLSKFLQREAIVLAHSRWPEGAVKIEYRLTVVPNSMRMGGDKWSWVHILPDAPEIKGFEKSKPLGVLLGVRLQSTLVTDVSNQYVS